MRMVCRECRAVSESPEKRPGTLAAEICLWLAGVVSLFSIPVLIAVPVGYSFWRIFGSRPQTCANCSSERLVLLNSPEAAGLLGGGAVGEIRRQVELDEALETEKDRRVGMAALMVLLGAIVAIVHYCGPRH